MTQLTTLTIRNGVHRAFYSDETSLIISKADAEGLSKAYNIRIETNNTNLKMKGRGYCTRGMNEISPGNWSIPMYRNSDDAECGIYQIEASTAREAFEIARKECWYELSANY